MTQSVKKSIEAGQRGFYLTNSIYLPFHFELLSIWIGKDMSLLAKPDLLVDVCFVPETQIP